MDAPSSRRFFPQLERLDSIKLLSATSAAILPTHGLVDLRTTRITNDLRNDLLRSTPHDGRQGWSLNFIKADPTTRIVYGSVTLLYHVKTLGFFYSNFVPRAKIKVDIAFATNLDDPEPGNVKVAVSRQEPGFGQNVRDTMALGVVAFLRQDHDLIASALA